MNILKHLQYVSMLLLLITYNLFAMNEILNENSKLEEQSSATSVSNSDQENTELESDRIKLEEAINYKDSKSIHMYLETLKELTNSKFSEISSHAYYLLGQIFEIGDTDHNVERNFTEALFYYNQSSLHGHPGSQEKLAFMWGTGKGVSVNKPMSLLYYAFAVQGKDTSAEMSLGYKYLYGHGVLKSCQKSIQKYSRVALKVAQEIKSSKLKMMPFQTDFPRLSDIEGYNSNSNSHIRTEEEDIVEYYAYSADSGDAPAQVTMGNLYLQGAYGVKQDFSRAFSYFEKAALSGDNSGVSHLGFMYAHGLGVSPDYSLAITYLRQAVEKGYPHAQNWLGYMYLHGYGVPQNTIEALKYFKLSADQGHTEGQVSIAILYYHGYANPNANTNTNSNADTTIPIKTRISSHFDEIKVDFPKALSYFSLAAHAGHPLALFYLGEMHQYGYGTVASCSLAVQLYKRVAEKSTKTTKLFEEAYSLYQQQEYNDALLRYEILAEQGFEIAQSNAGYMYDVGLGNLNLDITDDQARYQLAFQYYRNSAEQKNSISHLKIGDYYYSGLGCEKNQEKASIYYQAASDMRNSQAMFNLGYMHQYGLGIPKDLHLAKRHFDMSMQLDPDAYLAVYSALIILFFQFAYSKFLNFDINSFSISGYKWDTVLILLLAFILAVCIVIKKLS